MIVIDLNQTLFAAFFAAVGRHTNIAIEESLLRHMTLNCIRAINVKFREDYGRVVIAYDHIKCWRKDYFPFYKAIRKKNREESDTDWPAMFRCVGKITHELRNNFPYTFIQVEGCEADDVIGVLCEHMSDTGENIIIISGDKDFRQLQRYPNVRQYDSIRKTHMTEVDPARYLLHHVICGDRGDGIPNIMSDDNVFAIGERQRVMTAKRKKHFIDAIESGRISNDKYNQNWRRNETLIDLTKTPDDLKGLILEAYESGPVVKDRSDLMRYMSRNKLIELTSKIGDF